jgi:hypothetical protein
MPTEKSPMRMPHYQIRQAGFLRLEAKMTSAQFGVFTVGFHLCISFKVNHRFLQRMIRSTVKDCLDDLVRVEEQDAEALDNFLDTVSNQTSSLRPFMGLILEGKRA